MTEGSPPPAPPAVPAPAPPAERRRRAGAADMIRSLSVVLAFTLVVLLVGAGRVLIFPGHHAGPPAVQYLPDVRIASRVTGLTFPAPARLPSGWRATSVSLSRGSPVVLQLGLVTARNGYVGIGERPTADPAAAAAFIAGQLGVRGGGPVRGTLTVAGQVWQERRDNRGEVAANRTASGLTVVVVASAGPGDLRTALGLLG